MDYTATAKQILDHLGGEKNVASVTHCMTRLRFVLRDESGINDAQVKAIPGVVGVMRKGGQYQIIIGNEVSKCYGELIKLGAFSDEVGKNAPPAKHGNPVTVVLDAISGSMSPVIPAIIGAGMVQVLNIILGWFFPAENPTMQLLSVIGNTAFYFLPVLVAFSAGRKFGANPFLVTAVVAILIHPNFIALTGAEGGINFLGIPVTNFDYSSSIIPAILTAWVMRYIERLVEKITPSFTKNFLKPMLIILISTPIAFLILGPLGSFVGNGLAAVLVFVQSHVSIAAYIIMAAAMPFIVMTGMHWAFIPVVFAALETPEGETLMLPAMLISNLAQGAACLAVAVRSKNSGLKQIAASSGVSALFAGVTEPGLYGVTMPLKRPLAAVCISSGITGLLAGILNVAASSFASPSLFALPIFVHAQRPNNIIMAVICSAVAIVLSFVLTWILGFQDPVDAAASDSAPSAGTLPDGNEALRAEQWEQTVGAPMAGTLISLDQVDDETFSSGVLGAGAAIRPSEGKVYAPFDGQVETLPDSLHALGLLSDSGVELLIHVGLETVNLNGRHFTSRVRQGQHFRKGELLLEFDLSAIQAEGYDTVTPVVVTNADDFAAVTPAAAAPVKPEDPILQIQ